MKWKWLLGASGSSGPPRPLINRSSRYRSRKAAFESLERRKVFAADVAEAITAEFVVDDQSAVVDTSIWETAAVSDTAFAPDAQAVITMIDADGAVVIKTSGMVKRGDGILVPNSDAELSDTTATEGDYYYLSYTSGIAYTFGDTEVIHSEVDESIPIEMVMRNLEDSSDLIFYSMAGGDKDAPIVDEFGESDGSDVGIYYMTGSATDVGVEVTDVVSDQTDSDISIVRRDEDPLDEDVIFQTLGGGDANDQEVNTIDWPMTNDVNGDGAVSPLDLLLIINALNSFGSVQTGNLLQASGEDATVSTSADVNEDGYITALDALLLANYFNDLAANTESRMAIDSSFVPDEYLRIRNPEEDEELIEVDPSVEAFV